MLLLLLLLLLLALLLLLLPLVVVVAVVVVVVVVVVMVVAVVVAVVVVLLLLLLPLLPPATLQVACGEEELRLSSVLLTLKPGVELELLLAGSTPDEGCSSVVGSSSSILTSGAGSTRIEGLPVLPGNSGFECCR